MVFDPENNLKAIHNMMTKINSLHDEVEEISEVEQDLLVQQMSGMFSVFEEKPNKSLIAVENLMSALNNDMFVYKQKLENSKLAFQQFQKLRKANLSF
jgi:hypothetical protein